MAHPDFLIFLHALLTGSGDRQAMARLARLVSTGQISERDQQLRLAQNHPPRPKGEVLWLHAGDLESAQVCKYLFSQIHEDRPDLGAVLTLPSNVGPSDMDPIAGMAMVPLPEDSKSAARAFLTHWDPGCLVWTGGRFRPRLVAEAAHRGVPMISAETGQDAFCLDPPSVVPWLRNHIARKFDVSFCASEVAASLWKRAGLDEGHVQATGPLTDGAYVAHIDDDLLSAVIANIGTRPVWFADRVSAAEIADIVTAHSRGLRRAHRLLLFITVTDDNAMRLLVERCEQANLTLMQTNPADNVPEVVQVIAVDPAHKDIWYRASPVSFLGQSFAGGNGIDPLPAAAAGSAILHGPDVSHFAALYARLDTARAARLVRDGKELSAGLETLLSPEKVARQVQAAWEVTTAGAETADRITAMVHDFLDLAEGGST